MRTPTLCGITAVMMIWLFQSVFAGEATGGSITGSRSVSFSENIFMHTSRDIYFSGDALDFKAYVQHGHALNQGYAPGKVAYVSIFSSEGKAVAEMELTVNNGVAVGSVLLPDTLQTGFYGMAAWTNTMLLEETPHYFKQFLVINRFDEDISGFVQQHRLLPFGDTAYQDSPGDSAASALLPNDPDSLGFPTNDTDKPGFPKMGEGLQGGVLTLFDPVLNEIIHLTTEPGYLSSDMIIQAEKEVYGTDEVVRLQFNAAHDAEPMRSASLSVSRKEALFAPGSVMPDLVVHPGNNGTDAWPVSLVIPERYGPVLSGLVIDVDLQESVPDAVVLLSAVDTLVNLKYAQSRQDGSFYFLLEPYHQGKTLYLSMLSEMDAKPSQQILVRNKFTTKSFVPGKRIFDDGIQTFLSEALTMKRIQRVYRNTASPAAASLNDPLSTTAPLLFSKPSHTVKPDDYLPYDDFISLANEIVPNLRLRGRPDEVSASIIHPQTRSVLPNEPAFFMNGVYVPDLKSIISLSSKDITSIQVVNTPWMYGDLEFGGIVALFNNTRLMDVPHHPGYTILEASNDMNTLYAGAGMTRNGGQADIPSPGFSETIAWQPELSIADHLPQAFSFLTGELPGEYVVELKGITLSGKVITARSSIYVK